MSSASARLRARRICQSLKSSEISREQVRQLPADTGGQPSRTNAIAAIVLQAYVLRLRPRSAHSRAWSSERSLPTQLPSACLLRNVSAVHLSKVFVWQGALRVACFRRWQVWNAVKLQYCARFK